MISPSFFPPPPTLQTFEIYIRIKHHGLKQIFNLNLNFSHIYIDRIFGRWGANTEILILY